MKITLLQNAYGFLEEALSKALKAEKESIHWKYATLNLVQAIELSLKERLKREHPILIFQKVDSPKNTVNLYTALSRLQQIANLKISQSDITTISKASELRNRIVHFEFDLNEKEVKLVFAKLLGFLSHFHAVHLESKLDESVEPYLWQEAVYILDFAEELYKRAEKIFEDKGINFGEILLCPACEWDSFSIHADENTCYVCGYFSDISDCGDCGKLLFENEWHELQTGDERYERFCTECYEELIRNDERYYHEMMSHFWGK